MTILQDYAHLWDGSEPGWVLLQIDRQKLSVVIRFAGDSPTLREIAAIRAAVPSYAEMQTAVVVAALKGRSHVTFDDFNPEAGRRLADRCEQHGLTVETAVVHDSGYLPYNELSKQVMIIEEDAVAREVKQEALARGIRVKLAPDLMKNER